ncbi:MAG: SDR family NAD(P)-dependent oxidoreductase [Isosphaeraceae bacterium]
MRNALGDGQVSAAEIVRQLVLERGMTVLATARRQDRLDELAAELPEGRVLTESGDLADAEFRRCLWARAEAMPGGLDLLVNNAGLGQYAEFDEQELEAIRRIFDVNVIAPMDLTQRAAPHEARRSGQILQVSSILGFMGLPYSTAYVSSKFAVNGLVTSLRYELRGTGVRVWAACPGADVERVLGNALGDMNPPGPMPGGELTDKVVRGMLRRPRPPGHCSSCRPGSPGRP